MNKRLGLLVFLLAGCALVWLVLARLEHRYRAGEEKYSLIEEGLYQGGAVPEPPPGTGAVINLCNRDDPYRTDVYLWEPIPDRDPAPDLPWLRRMVRFIDEQRRAGVTTFVHCRNGASRSGMLVTAYVMYKNHWGRDRALAFVRSRRPETRPNPAFLARLAEWEHTTRRER
jgi:hypothetical protein